MAEKNSHRGAVACEQRDHWHRRRPPRPNPSRHATGLGCFTGGAGPHHRNKAQLNATELPSIELAVAQSGSETPSHAMRGRGWRRGCASGLKAHAFATRCRAGCATFLKPTCRLDPYARKQESSHAREAATGMQRLAGLPIGHRPCLKEEVAKGAWSTSLRSRHD